MNILSKLLNLSIEHAKRMRYESDEHWLTWNGKKNALYMS